MKSDALGNFKNWSDVFKSPKKPGRLSPARVIVGSFLAVILCGTLLLMLPFSTKAPGGIPFLNALFTATSATCVTGLVVYDTFSAFTLFGQVVIMLLIQIGGLGLVTLTTFFSLVMGKRLGFKSLKLASDSVNFDNAAAAKKIIYTVMRITFTCEACGAILLLPALAPEFGARAVWLSVFTAISAFCNAGFDLFGSVAPYTSLTMFSNNWYVLSIIMLLIVFGGLGFIVWSDILLYPKSRKLMLHSRIVLLMTGVLILLGAVVIGAMEWNNTKTIADVSLSEKILSALFQSVSCRTAGFNSIDLGSMHILSKLACTFLMFIGAAPGGTGGGVKVTTFAIIIMTVMGVSSGREDPIIRGRRIDKKTVYKSLTIVTIAMMVVMFTTLVLVFDTPARNGMIDGNLIDCLFEAVSAFGTVGLSVGVTATMGTIAKIVTILAMLIGRVGPISMAMTLSISAGDQCKRAVLPEAKISVG
ncbi:potassium transporter TrkG [Pygmaiobacter massiliensis]|uniref:TrkH family potassium uptake protein n=1 Tax=Pygmaiobacter massiliensis TaxID=1917873 RepID=UPI002A8162BA|nr:potassium transporter TrkG [Pygmaiobacter massiliensis]MDY4784538.1 potassium transporter TrkG [Pygmaiobacter massiliensis]